MDLDNEWENFLNSDSEDELETVEIGENKNENSGQKEKSPECGILKISTKTKIVYLNQNFDLKELFWKINLMDYMELNEGIIKKQIKYNFTNKSEVNDVLEKLENEKNNVVVNVLSQIDNPTGRVKFKDVRKISIGIDKSNMSFKETKTKSAFYNCFVLILRVLLRRVIICFDLI